ncbi:50S ribosomal protein L10 [Candidatus Woesearchaeota archaeon]|nr:50S ribosomal protein L10 [Candidatus Woesearchaeota archaeon]
MAAHVAEWKHGEVKEITDLLTNNKVIGVVEIGGIPAPQMQIMRKNLHGTATIRSAKNNLIFRSLEEAESQVKGISGLKDLITGQSAIIVTDESPFKLFAQIKSSRTMAPAKGGEKAAHDISVKAGETPFKPGPIVGELQKVGIPAAIQEGKVVIKEDKVIVPQGERISAEIAQMLTRLEIFPIEIGMSLHAVYEDGAIFKADVLDIDIDAIMGQMKQASTNAFNLAIEAGWFTKLTIQPLIMKAHHNALTLALDKGIVNKETIKNILSKAHASMLALKNITS